MAQTVVDRDHRLANIHELAACLLPHIRLRKVEVYSQALVPKHPRSYPNHVKKNQLVPKEVGLTLDLMLT